MMTKTLGFSVSLVAAMAMSLLATSCNDGPVPWARRPITRSYVFPARDAEGNKIKEGKTVDAATLNLGRVSYMHYCYACHGENGDGKGPASHGYRPPPRDFRSGNFKFGAVRSGDLPNDDGLIRIVQGGLHGTAMLEWDIPLVELVRVIQFIKTFPLPPCENASDPKCAAELKNFPDNGKPNRWQEVYKRGKKKGQPKPTGEVIAITKDPWAGKEAAAVAKGAEVYHLKAQCANCHPGYLTRQDFSALALKVEGKPKTSFRKGLYLSIVLAAKDNPYKVALMPPDFTLNPLRSIRKKHQMNDLYRLIASGVGGVMPAWIDGLDQKEIWAIAHYVRTLMALSTPEKRSQLHQLQDKLATQPAFVAPKPKVEPEKGPEEEGADADDDEAGDKAGDEKDADKKDAKDADEKAGDKKPEGRVEAPTPPKKAPAKKAPAKKAPAKKAPAKKAPAKTDDGDSY